MIPKNLTNIFKSVIYGNHVFSTPRVTETGDAVRSNLSNGVVMPQRYNMPYGRQKPLGYFF